MSEINELFSKCDGWNAKEWFERLVKAVDSRNEAVRSGDEIAFATHNNIASSSASRLAMEFRDEIRAALSSAAVAEREPVAWRYKLFESDPKWTVATEKPKGVVVEPLFTTPPTS